MELGVRWKDLRRSSNVRDVRGAGGGGGCRCRSAAAGGSAAGSVCSSSSGCCSSSAGPTPLQLLSRRWRRAEQRAGPAADGRRRGQRFRRARARQHRGRVGRAVRAIRRAISAAGAHAVRRRRAIGVRFRELGIGPVLLPERPARLSRYVVLRRARAHGRPRRFRGGVRHRPRGRSSRADAARHVGSSARGAAARERGRRQSPASRDGAAGRLLRGRLGLSREPNRARARARRRRGGPRRRARPSATTGCSATPGAP